MKDEVRAFLKEYGDNFKKLRYMANLRQVDVAAQIRCSQAIISHIECGYMLPPHHIEEALLQLYKKYEN